MEELYQLRSQRDLEHLRSVHPWRSINKFMPFASSKGFTKSEVQKFFKENVMKDKLKINNSQYYLPIFGKTSGCYQFDTLIQSRGSIPPAFLVFININSRKAYAYPITNKGKNEVLRVLKIFLSENETYDLTSDQDSAYLNDDVIDFLNSKGIEYHTTEDNNHNVLGIINRFMRTLRDLNKERDFTVEGMKRCVNEYNNSYHSALSKSPNEFTSNDEKEYITKMYELTKSITANNGFMLNKGDKVRIVLDKPAIGKKRSNLSSECYIVDSLNGYGYNVKSKDDSVAFYPRHKLVLSKNGNIAQTLNNGKRGIVAEIISYNPRSDKYKVVYEGGVKDEIKAKNFRETNPTRLSKMEIEFWKTKDDVPSTITKYKGLD